MGAGLASSQAVEGLVGKDNVPLRFAGASTRWITFNGGEVQIDTRGLPAVGVYQEWAEFIEGRTPPLSSNKLQLPIKVEVVPVSTISTSPNEPVTVDGLTYLSPQSFAWLPGSLHTLSVPACIATASGHLLFSQWSDSEKAASRNVSAPGKAVQLRDAGLPDVLCQ